jgi:hypothetical protein
MAQWRIRSPEEFPRHWHKALTQGPQKDFVLERVLTERTARAKAEQFRLFRFCLREHPSNGTTKIMREQDCTHRTRVAWNPDVERWELLLTSSADPFSVAGLW